jgi:outer membrane biosynthesis protein TonB
VREAYVRAQDRKRRIISLSLTALLYAMAAGALWLSGSLTPDSLSAYSGPITVRLGSPEGTDETSKVLPSPHATPEGKGIPAAPVTPPTPAAPVVPAAHTARPLPPAPAPVPETTTSTNAVSVPKDTTKESPKPPVPASEASTAQPTTGTVQSATSAGGTGGNGSAPEGPATSTGPISVKGSENGNAYETNFEAGSGRIGRGLYVPIYLFMPLPFTIDDSVYARIPAGSGGLRTADQRRTAFRSAYELQSGVWRLKVQPALDARPELWKTLEDSGYPIARAEYKSGKTLSPVVLSFKVSAAAKGKMPTLESVEVVSSCGSPDIDAAVVFGFRQAAFYNDGTSSVTGRFTYRFE